MGGCRCVGKESRIETRTGTCKPAHFLHLLRLFKVFLVQVRDVPLEHACTLFARLFESGPKPELNFSFEYVDLHENPTGFTVH